MTKFCAFYKPFGKFFEKQNISLYSALQSIYQNRVSRRRNVENFPGRCLQPNLTYPNLGDAKLLDQSYLHNANQARFSISILSAALHSHVLEVRCQGWSRTSSPKNINNPSHWGSIPEKTRQFASNIHRPRIWNVLTTQKNLILLPSGYEKVMQSPQPRHSGGCSDV